ncbi:TadE/TadG family type IV pilus assembly protein [Hyalangium versicolor]|uniref:TadE/TadG family type IV pilus assembly protein n=1 Tax=Hyalangium versicolor TaxID=2861190 RepID=UPI001CCF4B37|nr:TadE/TadG family type IV pilus assembly protein [Hyalangium versicolor]
MPYPSSLSRQKPSRAQRGQATVEAALTLPLLIFLFLGTLQLFLLLQAQALTGYATFRAVRSGSVKYGDCEAMTHAAIAALLPSFARTDSPVALGSAFRLHRENLYAPAADSGHSGNIVWIHRERPLASEIREDEERSFDDPARYSSSADVTRLEARLVFWYPMRIPFANWVLSSMFLAQLGLRDFVGVDPLQPVHETHWRAGQPVSLDAAIRQEMLARADRREYAFPLQATYAMRMMTPPRPRFFATQNCPLTPSPAP